MAGDQSIFLKSAVRQTWLHYFNQYLLEHNVISEDEWRKMRRRIDGRP